MQTFRAYIGGDTGMRKTTTAASLVALMAARGKLGRLVVISTDAARGIDRKPAILRRLCDHAVIIGDDAARQGINWRAALDRAPRLYVEVAATRYPAGILGELAAEVFNRGWATVIADEAHKTVPVGADPRLLRLWGEGRKRGIDCVAVTASVMVRDGSAMNPAVLDASDVRVGFRAGSDIVALKIMGRNHPRLASELARLPGPERGTPHFLVHRAGQPRAEIVTPSGSRWIQA